MPDRDARLYPPNSDFKTSGNLRISIPCGELSSGWCKEYLPATSKVIIPVVISVAVVYALAIAYCMFRRYKRWRTHLGKYVTSTRDMEDCACDKSKSLKTSENEVNSSGKRATTNSEEQSTTKQHIEIERKFARRASGGFRELSTTSSDHRRRDDGGDKAADVDFMDAISLREKNRKLLGDWVPYLDIRILAVGLRETELRELKSLDFMSFLEVLEQSNQITFQWRDMACSLDSLMLGLRNMRCRISSARLGWVAWMVKPRQDSLISLSALFAAHVTLQDEKTFEKVIYLVQSDLESCQVGVAEKLTSFNRYGSVNQDFFDVRAGSTIYKKIVKFVLNFY